MSDRVLDRSSIDDEDRRRAQRSIRARLEQIRDDLDALLDGETEADVDEIEGVIFGLADGDLAEARATQRAGSTPPAPLLRILGELLDGFAQSSKHSKSQIAAYTIRMMEESKASADYSQTASVSREDDA